MKHTLMLLVAVTLLLLGTACSALTAAATADKAVEIATEAKAQIAAADKNNDGRISWTEGLGALLLTAVGALGLGANSKANRAQRDADELYDKTHVVTAPTASATPPAATSTAPRT